MFENEFERNFKKRAKPFPSPSLSLFLLFQPASEQA
jgi:hypothetical protein